MVMLETLSLRPRGNGNDIMELRADEGTDGIGVAEVGVEDSEMGERLDERRLGVSGAAFLVGEGDLRSKEREGDRLPSDLMDLRRDGVLGS